MIDFKLCGSSCRININHSNYFVKIKLTIMLCYGLVVPRKGGGNFHKKRHYAREDWKGIFWEGGK